MYKVHSGNPQGLHSHAKHVQSAQWYPRGAGAVAPPVFLPFWYFFEKFRWPTKEACVLTMDAAFAAVAAWEGRSDAAWAA